MYGNASVEEWTARYEAVRQRALSTQHPDQSGWELALLVRRGVAAWLRAWPSADQPQSSCRASLPPSDTRPTTDVKLSASLSEQITSLLVNMILPQRSLDLESVS
jgi:hypothetical protein